MIKTYVILFICSVFYSQTYNLEFSSEISNAEITINGSNRKLSPFIEKVKKGLVKIEIYSADTLFSSFEINVVKDEKFKINFDKVAYLYLMEAKNYFKYFDDMEYYFASKNGQKKDFFNHLEGQSKVYLISKYDKLSLTYPSHDEIILDFENFTPFLRITYHPIFKPSQESIERNVDVMINDRRSIYNYSMIALGSVLITSSILSVNSNGDADKHWDKYKNSFKIKTQNDSYKSYTSSVSLLKVFSTLAVTSAVSMAYIHFFSPYFDFDSIEKMKYQFSSFDSNINLQITYSF